MSQESTHYILFEGAAEPERSAPATVVDWHEEEEDVVDMTADSATVLPPPLLPLPLLPDNPII